ncbi:hypothetical protein OCC_10454 [Thermococcus litoralis DSM 5473]|uniref:Uncharacterized protein n=1 Tax=Thermococcus litoralis (strain ATCC 51850 / DSM 5473 / JCM 8560 / NS-C) TaxID=523849 RepID=H3ZR53_THELN|nr:hypothetical protein [Thermococcus litoralis]EHR77522.1 hypothetical protein OCC_10454 [Thermococcus litoralis DSM 5473]
MDLLTAGIILVGMIAGIIIAAALVSKIMSAQYEQLYEMLKVSSTQETTTPYKKSLSTSKNDKEKKQQVDEKELLKKLREVIDAKVSNVMEEAKQKKERLLMLLDVAKGYTLGYVTAEEYNMFLIKVLNELEDFKRLWLAKFPSSKDKEQLELLIKYVAATKLPITIKTKDKNTLELSPEEALIRITSSINSAVEILDRLMESRNENPAVTPLEVKLTNEVEKLQKKLKGLEKQLEELRML